MKVKISSGEVGTVITLTSESEKESQALKDLWNRKGELLSLETWDPSTTEIEIATTD